MQKRLVIGAISLVLLSGMPAVAQVTGGVLHVNNTHMS
jgi:hypothetical protein